MLCLEAWCLLASATCAMVLVDWQSTTEPLNPSAVTPASHIIEIYKHTTMACICGCVPQDQHFVFEVGGVDELMNANVLLV